MTATTTIAATKIGKNALTTIVAPEAKPISQPGVTIGTRDYQAWVNSDGSIETGIWECDAGVFHSRFEHHGELILILAGEMVCTPDGGEPFTLAEGDACTFPRGWSGEWNVLRPIRKLYAVWTNES